jgi:hypothetical protein
LNGAEKIDLEDFAERLHREIFDRTGTRRASVVDKASKRNIEGADLLDGLVD